jgi:molybdopterin converting factor small subunit
MTTTVGAITVRVLLFGSYAEKLSRDTMDFTLDPGATVADILRKLRTLPGGESVPPRPLCAVNLAHATPDSPVADGDEVAVLPPLAGG